MTQHPDTTAKLNAAIQASGLTVEAVAQAGDLDPNRLSHVLAGTRIANSGDLRKIEKALGIPRRNDWLDRSASTAATSRPATFSPAGYPVPPQPQIPGFPGLSDRLRQIRGPRTPEEFARLMCCPPSVVEPNENFPRVPDPDNLFLYSAAGQVTIEWILFGRQDLEGYRPTDHILLKSVRGSVDAYMAAQEADRKGDHFEAERQRAAEKVWNKMYFITHFHVSTAARLVREGIVPDYRDLLCRLLKLDPATVTDAAILAATNTPTPTENRP
jgi:transcriptional regulator with XRE-family HTH domain